MPQSSSNRQDIICVALDTLKNYPLDSKPPSINSIAKSFGFSEITLRRAVKNGGPLNRSEVQLASYCINMQKLGFGLTKSGVKYYIMEIIQLNKRQHPFGKNGSGACQVHKILHGNSHEHISLASTISAARSYIPLLIIYKSIRTIPDLLEGAPSRTIMGFTNTGYMREELFQMYLNYFINLILPIRPVLLILDDHKSYINYMSIDFCRQNGILLYALPPYTTHVLQPSEIPFAKLKKEYNKSCDRYSNNNNSMIVKKHTFAKVFGSAFLETYTLLAICNAYKAIGILPFNPNAISPDQLDPSLTTEQFNYSE
ncbi:5506_t:CDS:2 [Funneliformis geosporum]|uniref:5506_t:CDS:1 n=1 Tax=Funneliformis geosporum TaxID=1117311 RepID=A0A9W4SJ22_9GLOM|nr:5506_t:CDS:2 [Funneliformis geosporum]